MIRDVHPRLLLSFSRRLGWQGMRSVHRFERGRRRGHVFPPFWFLSVTDSCNLNCQGCWVTQAGRQMDFATLDRVVSDAKAQGCSFFGLLGGEPLLHPDILRIPQAHPDCFFQLFTNGTMLTSEVAVELRRLGNVTPVISIEGNEAESDRRRGAEQVYSRALAALKVCRENRLIFGVAASVCQTNIDQLATDQFLHFLVERGAHYMWYYIYRPVGADPAPELALNAEQITRLRRFLVEVRHRVPLVVVDSYWDHEGRALCPAAIGISHHIGPGGDIEPCPVVQFADRNARRDGLPADIADSAFLARFRSRAAACTRGCILLEDPQQLADVVEQSGARDTSGRDVGLCELRALTPCAGHHQPGNEIPETHPLYRFAKKHWFFGFGAYG